MIATISVMPMEDVQLNMLDLQELEKYPEVVFPNHLVGHVQEHQESVKIATMSWLVEQGDHSKSVSNPNPAIQIVDPSRVLIIASTNARQMGVAVQNMLGPFGQDQSPGAAFQKVLVVEDV